MTMPWSVVLAFLIGTQICLADLSDILANLKQPDVEKTQSQAIAEADSNTSRTLRVSSLPLEPYTGFDASTGDFKGIEIDLVRLLADRLQLTLQFEFSNNRSLLLKNLLENNSDIIIGGLFVSYTDHAHSSSGGSSLISSVPYVFDDITWCVATAKPQPKWLNIFSIFPVWMWFTLLIIGYLNAELMYVMMHFEENRYNRWDYHVVCLMMFSTNITLPFYRCPSQNIGIRLFYMYLLLYGMLIIAVFNSFVIKNLTQPILWPQVDSEDLIREQYMEVVGEREAFVLYKNGVHQNEIATFVRQHFWPCPNIDLCLGQLRHRDDLAVAVSRLHSRNTRHIHSSQMFCFPQARGNIVNYPVRMLMRAGFRSADRVDEYIQRAFEAGLIRKWSADNEVRSSPVIVNEQSGDKVVLTMEHLTGAWFAVGIGLPLSGLTLIAEHLALRQLRIPDDGSRWYRFVVWAEAVILRPGRSYWKGYHKLVGSCEEGVPR